MTVTYVVTVPQVWQVSRLYLVVVVLCCVPFCCADPVTAPDLPSGPLLSCTSILLGSTELGSGYFSFLISTLIFLMSLGDELFAHLLHLLGLPFQHQLLSTSLTNSLCSGRPQLAPLLKAAVFLGGRKSPAAFPVFPLSPFLFLMLWQKQLRERGSSGSQFQITAQHGGDVPAAGMRENWSQCIQGHSRKQ